MLKFFKKSEPKKDSLLTSTKSTSRPQFNTLKVGHITRETADCVSVAFEVPDALREQYRFLPGQYLTLETSINGEKVRRSYSLCSSPTDGELRVAIKKVENGLFSTFANEELSVGSEMQVMTPDGNFIPKAEQQGTKSYVAFAAGSGITPVFSIMKSVLEQDDSSTFILFFGNKTSQSIIFRDKIDALKNQYMNRLEVHHILSQEDQGTDYLKGRLDEGKCLTFSEKFFEPLAITEYFLCGPEVMINALSKSLENLGVAKGKIRFELFTSPSQNLESKSATVSDNTSSSKITSAVTVILDGDETHFNLASDGISVLDTALDNGADVPFACKGAVCCTCRAKIVEGSAKMDMNYALEEDEVSDGYILTCQAHPTSEKVVISFDE